MRIQILDYQVGPHTFRMVKPSDFNIFKALPSLIPLIYVSTGKMPIASFALCPTAHTLYPSPHGKAGKTIGWSATITSGNASSTYRPAGQKHRLRKTKRTSY